AWWDMKQRGAKRPLSGFIPIHMPKNTAAGVVIAGLSTACAFGLIWHIWWLAGAAFAATVVASIVHTFNYKRDYHIPAETVAETEAARTELLKNANVCRRPRLLAARRRSQPVLRHRRPPPPAERPPAGVLAVPHERPAHLRLPVRGLRRARPQLRGRPDRRGPVRPAAGGGQHRDAAAVVDHLRLRDAVHAASQHRRRARLAGGDRAVRPGLPGPGAVRVLAPDP